ncbi:hypothetical protein B0H14DRAFT_3780570 [Mycena olivaceomarginata]|nr:hypothetical protein B0H14DRAFT_3780570 [Mycena olivaceomarginata]
MAKSLKGAAAAKLIADATSAPGVFVFSELLELANIQELSKHETHSKSYALLELFAYRTYEDYMQNKDAFPPLNAAPTTKLKHLSIVSLASQRRVCPLFSRTPDLLRALDMPTKQDQLEVEYTMGRDLAPGAVDAVLAALRDWASTTASVLSTLDAKLAAVAAQAASHKDHLAAHDAALQSALLAAAKDKNSKRGGLGMAYGGNVLHDRDAMDVDSEPGLIDRMLGRGEQENVKGKGRKCVHFLPFACSVLTIPPQTHPDSSKPQRKRNRF